MGNKLSTLTPPEGAKQKRKRLGRGHGSGLGTTAGRGQKGQGSRSGPDLGRGFEGGQMPLQRRLPKRGFKNPFRVEYCPVNVGRLAKVFEEAGAEIGPEVMKERGVAPRRSKWIKILGNGEIGHALQIKAHAFSQSAIEKIQAAGGSVEVISRKQQVTSKGQATGE